MMARLPRWLWVAGGVAILIGALALVIFLRGGFQTPQPAKLSLNSTNPQALLQEADYLAYLGNWEKACPYFAKAQRLFSAQLGRKKPLSFREIRTRLFPVAKIGQVISFLKQCLGIRRVETELSGLRRLEPAPKEDHECKGADQDRDASGHPQPPGKTRHHSDVTLQ